MCKNHAVGYHLYKQMQGPVEVHLSSHTIITDCTSVRIIALETMVVDNFEPKFCSDSAHCTS